MKLVELGPHSNMTPEECLTLCARNHQEYADVIVIGIDPTTGEIFLRSSEMGQHTAVFYLLKALDQARDDSRYLMD